MNAIVFVLQGCPLAAIGAYGNEWVVTPNLDQLAAEGIVLDQLISVYPYPIQARNSWRSGQFPWARPQSPEASSHENHSQDLLSLLKAAGVRTILLNHCRPSHPLPTDFLRGWDEIHSVPPIAGDESPADSLISALPTILASLPTSSPWLLWIESDRLLPPWHIPQAVFELYIENLLEEDKESPHSASSEVDSSEELGEEPRSDELADDEHAAATHVEDRHEAENSFEVQNSFDEEDGNQIDNTRNEASCSDRIEPWTDPPAGWFDTEDFASWELLHRSFDSAITSWDADFGRVVQLLKEAGLDQSAHWLLTSDYGFPLGEHGIIGRFRPWLHEERVHLPCIIRLAGAAEAGRRVPSLTQPVDLMPTLATWLGRSVASGDGNGIDLTPLLLGQVPAIRTEAISMLAEETGEEWSIRTSDWAYLSPRSQNPDDEEEPRPPQLYAKPADRWEQNNQCLRESSRADAFAERLQAVIGPGSSATNQSP